MNKKIDQYINFVYENDKGMKFHKVNQDSDMFDGKGKLILNANTKGNTIMLVSEIP